MPVYTILWDGTAQKSGTGFVLATFAVTNESLSSTAKAIRPGGPVALPIIQSDFGDIQPFAQAYGKVASDTTSGKTLSWYGISCNLTRSSGYANLTRATTRVRDWTISSSEFSQAAEDTPSLLYPLYKALFPYQAPTGSVSGFGTALGAYAQLSKGVISTPNMTAYAHAFVQASGAIETSLLNSAVSNSTLVPRPETFKVAGVETALKYRMTYVPGLLVLGLIGLILCAGIVLGMTVSSWGSMSPRSTRLVDGLRFVVDFAATMRRDEELHDANTWSRARLERWANSTQLRYEFDATDKKDKRGNNYIQLMRRD
jgi:hypothetical protein